MKRCLVAMLIFLIMPVTAGGLAVSKELAGARELMVTRAWVRASLPGQTVASAFVTMENPLDKPLVLKEIHSKVADAVELHTHVMVDGQLRMRKMENVILPAKGKLTFMPGENHIMLIGLANPLQENASVTIEMCFDELCSVIEMPVIGINKEEAFIRAQ